MLFVSLSTSVSISVSETSLREITGSLRPSSATDRSQHQTERYNSNLLCTVLVSLSRCRTKNTSNCSMAARINITQETKSAKAWDTVPARHYTEINKTCNRTTGMRLSLRRTATSLGGQQASGTRPLKRPTRNQKTRKGRLIMSTHEWTNTSHRVSRANNQNSKWRRGNCLGRTTSR